MGSAWIHLQPHRVDISGERRLRHAVGAHERCDEFAREAADVDEVAAGGRHVVGHGLRDLDGGRDVCVEILAEFGRVRLQDLSPARPAHAEEEVVDAPENPERLAGHAAPFAGPREIGREAPHPGAGLSGTLACGECVPHTLARPAHDEHAGSRSIEMPGQSETEAGRSARHDHPSVLP